MVNLESSYYHIAKCLLSGGLKVHAMYGNTELGVSNLTAVKLWVLTCVTYSKILFCQKHEKFPSKAISKSHGVVLDRFCDSTLST